MARSAVFGAFAVLWLPSLGTGAAPVDPVVWGSTATIASGGWGRLARLPGGSWIAVTTAFPAAGPSRLEIHASAGEGKSWRRIAELSELGRKLDNGHLALLPGGDLLLTGRSIIDGQSYRLPVYRSADGGRTWAALSAIDSSEGPPGTMDGKGLWEPHILVLDPRKVAAFYADETHAGFSQVISERVSADGGKTWGGEIRVAAEPRPGRLRPGMPVPARMSDGRTIVAYEVVGLGKGDVYRKVSRDGVTWERGIGSPVPLHRVGPFVACLPDGRLFLSSGSNLVSLSEDGGESWTKLPASAWDLGSERSWPAIYEMGAGRLGVVVNADGQVKLRIGEVRPASWPDPFLDDFDDGDAAGWTVYTGSAAVSDGSYRLQAARGDAKALTGSTSWTDGYLEADVLIESEKGGGLIFRALNPWDAGPDAFFGYFAGFGMEGFLLFGKMDGTWKELARAKVTVKRDRWHRLGVSFVRNSIRIYFDDPSKPKIAVTDATYRRGQIGVRVYESDMRLDRVSFRSGARAPSAPPSR